MVVSHLGDRHPGTISSSSSIDEVSHGHHRVLYKVDKGITRSTNHNSQDSTLRMDEHSLSFWNPKALGVWQWHPVCKPTVGQTMHGARYQAGVHINWTPSNKWTGRVRQPNVAQGPKKKVGKSKRNLGGLGPQNCVGLPHHSPIHHQGNTF